MSEEGKDPASALERAGRFLHRRILRRAEDPTVLTPKRVVFLLPAFLLLLALIAVPVVGTVLTSFVPEGESTYGVDNYEEVFTDPDTFNTRNLPWPPPLGTFIHNALWIVIHLPLSLFGGLILAVMLKEMRGSSIIKSSIFLGMVTPLIVGGVILRFLLEAGVGLVPAFFGVVGVESLDINWMLNRETVLIGLILGSVWLWMGFSLIIYSAGLTTIPEEFFEAARVDGSTPFRTFVKITFPLLKPMTLVIVTMSLLWELKIFDIVFVATNESGGPSLGPGSGAADVLALQMYRYAFVGIQQFGLASVVATLLTLLTLVAAGGLLRSMVRG